jgi:hypothetical protein
MGDLRAGSLLSQLHAVPYQAAPLPEDMTSFGDDEPLEVVPNVNLDYEISRDAWHPISPAVTTAADSRLPWIFVDGAVSSTEIASGVQDDMGYARSIRAGQIGVGALSLRDTNRSAISCGCFIAVSTVGYSEAEIEPLREDLRNHPRAFELITWEAASDSYFHSHDEREAAIRDYTTVRNRLRRRVTDEMLEAEEQLVRHIDLPAYVDGRFVDHLPARDDQLVVGVIKTMRRRYLDMLRLPVLYALNMGERTPAFEVESKDVQVVSFYARISRPLAGAANGIVRVELGKAHFENRQQRDCSLLDALTMHMTQLCTRESSYPRAAVTLEPIRVIETRIQKLFQPMEQITMSALNALR